MRYTILGFVLSIAAAAADSGTVTGSDYDQVRPVILAQDWTIPQVALNSRGTIAIAGGQPFRSPDGLMLITPDRTEKIVARRGDRIPGLTDKSFARFFEIALDERDNLVFVASVVACDLSDASCENSSSSSGVFLYSRGSILPITLTGEIAPGTDGKRFSRLRSVKIKNSGMIAFAAIVSSEGGPESPAVYLFSEGRLQLVAEGENVQLLSLTESGAINLFEDRTDGARIRRYFVDVIATTLTSDDPRLLGFSITSAGWGNARGDVLVRGVKGSVGVDRREGLFLLTHKGEVIKIVLEGEELPGYGTFWFIANPFLDHSGNVLFLSAYRPSLIGSLFLFSKGILSEIATNFWTIYSRPNSWPRSFAVNADGTVVIGGPGGYSVRSGSQVTPVATNGERAPEADEELFTGFSFPWTTGINYHPMSLNDAGELVFLGTLCCGRFDAGLFSAGPSRLRISNGGFEQSGSSSLPMGWETSWSNFGTTDAELYDSGGNDSFLGNSVLRLHVGPGGGQQFVLSDPIEVKPNDRYVVTAPVRFYFNSTGENGFVSLIQYDHEGREIQLDEIRLVAGQSRWTWESQTISVRTRADAASVRLRIGLISPFETYLDVDGIQ